MSEHQANLDLVERAKPQWQVGKNFDKVPPVRKKPTLLQKVLKLIFGK